MSKYLRTREQRIIFVITLLAILAIILVTAVLGWQVTVFFLGMVAVLLVCLLFFEAVVNWINKGEEL